MSSELGCLDTLPRVRLGHTPTPIDDMANLARVFDDLTLRVKRDDCTGLAFGGNKVRQLEFYMGEAQAQRADTILITGARQSNFVRLAAAAARTLRMDCHIQLEERVTRDDPLYRESGNVLLDRLLGATLHTYPDGEDETGADERLDKLAVDLASKGRRPYVVHLAPGHKPLGALGYVVAARELLHQLRDRGQTVDAIVVASGSGNTHAGLLFGLRAMGSPIAVHGVCVRRDAETQHARITARCHEIADLLVVSSPVRQTDIHLDDRFLKPGYGELNDAASAAIDRAAHTEALILDPVYTAKTMAGFLDQASRAAPGQSLLFWHTGGAPAMFAYGADLAQNRN